MRQTTLNAAEHMPATRRRRGAALLLVLATLVLVSTAIASAARLSSLGVAQQRMLRDERLALDLLHAAEAPILRWLNVQAHRVVLAPDATSPEVSVLDDHFTAADTDWSLRVTAWDQCGMIPGLESIDAWRGSLPDDFFALARRVLANQQSDTPHTIAPLGMLASDARLSVADRLRILPRPAARASQPCLFGEAASEASGHADKIASKQPSPYLGAHIATRVEALRRRDDGSSWASINVHTAPRGVLDASFKQVGRGGLDAVLAARVAGRPVVLPDLGERHEGSGIEFVTSSPVWSFRIDAGVGLATRSSWVVYARLDGQWQLVQRWVIPV